MFLFFIPTGPTIKFSFHFPSFPCYPFIVRISAARGTSGSALAGFFTVNHTVVQGNKKPSCQGESRQSTRRQNKLSTFISAHSCLKQLWAGIMDDLKGGGLLAQMLYLWMPPEKWQLCFYYLGLMCSCDFIRFTRKSKMAKHLQFFIFHMALKS